MSPRALPPVLPAVSRPAWRSPAALLALALTLLLLVPAAARAEAPEDVPTPTSVSWPEELVDLVARTPVQAEGRIKPLDTWARFTLLATNHRRSVRDLQDEKRGPTAWLLDAWLRPDLARRYECIMVENAEVLTAVGLDKIIRKKRDRYSYDELQPGMGQLQALASRYRQIEQKQRDAFQQGTLEVYHSMAAYGLLLRYLDFARERIPLPDSDLLRETFGEVSHVRFSTVLEKAPALVRVVREAGPAAADPHAAMGQDPEVAMEAMAASRVLQQALSLAQTSRLLAIFPPDASRQAQETWYSPYELFEDAAAHGEVSPRHLALLRHLEAMADTAGDAKLVEHARALHDGIMELATERGEAEKIDLEVALYDLNPFGNGLVLYLIAFLLLAMSWLMPRVRALRWGVWGFVILALGLHVTGIVIRCILRERPPISTLYETVLFITAFCVLASLVIERINRQRLALALAPTLGALGLFVANKYEMVTAEDTMPQLVAVLDTNFWLATHVTCITIGYAAGLLAAAIAHVHVLGRAFGLKSDDPSFYRNVGRTVYGVLGFALIFSVVGTILGGVWANDSWGRFWGWDPKENGALMIVLAQIAILHARLGGFLKPFGISMATIGQGLIVAFSWWGVNLLGIGLHSYGFASGVMTGLKIFYATELAVLLTGGIWWWRNRLVGAKA